MKKPIIFLIIAIMILCLCGCADLGRGIFGVPEPMVVYEDEEESELSAHPKISGYMAAADGYACYHLAILVNFIDIKLSTTEEEWEGFFYGDSKSVSAYYLDQSKGLIQVTPAAETNGIEDNGVIVVEADMMHPNLDAEYMEYEDDDDETTLNFLDEVLYQADDYINFSAYDENGDGSVLPDELVITIIAAGYEDDPNFIYDEKSVSGVAISEEYSLEYDQVGIGDYILTGEIHFDNDGNEIFPTIGIACHEFGHALGLPDLYDTDYSSQGVGFHALMADGASNGKWDGAMGAMPAPLTAWSKEYLGIIEPQIVDTDGEYVLYARSLDEFNVIKIQEYGVYYLLENVDFAGYGAGLDVFMELPGIAVWRIDESKTTEDIIFENTVNDDEDQMGIALIEAGGTQDMYSEDFDYFKDDYNHYFSESNGESFTTDGGTVITFLTEPGDVMTVEIVFGS